MNENLLWEIRLFVYQHFAETTRPPVLEETATQFGLTYVEAASAYEELHRRHALFLKPNRREIWMANPFSGIETPFRVHANHKTYFANCAWDSLGIPAALHVDAQVEAACAQSGEKIDLSVQNQQASAERSRSVQGSNALVHFLVPFKDWYDDLAFT